MKRYGAMICLAALSVSAAFAQQSKTVPPKPADQGPSLEVTLKFIQDKLNDVGEVNFAIYWYNNILNRQELTYQTSYEVSNVVAHPARCGITFHRKVLNDGRTVQDLDDWFSFHDVLDLAVRTGEQEVKKAQNDIGDHTYDTKFDPPLFVLAARRPKNKRQQPSGWQVAGTDQFFFTDEEMANRVAKAMVHAVELCGGGSKPEPF
ncbi:MAG TPA: hypothetical protein VK828_09805 [Terriglobales bacterium]|nr:hypothetical protein [Terriglobales bacterium]